MASYKENFGKIIGGIIMNKKVKAYIDAIFSDLGDERELEELREEIATNLDERMQDYIDMGMSENKAYTKAILELGDIDEIIWENKKIVNNANDEYRYSEKKSDNSDENQRKRYILLSVGVALTIVSIIFPIIAEEVEAYESILNSCMFLTIAIGVGMIVYSTRYIKKREEVEKSFQTIDDREDYNIKKRKIKSINEVVWVLATLIFLVVGFFLYGWSYAWIIFIIAALINKILVLVYVEKV